MKVEYPAMTSKRLLVGAAVLAALELAAVPSSASARAIGLHSSAAIHRTGGFGFRGRFFDRARIGGISYSRGFVRRGFGWGWGRGRFVRGFRPGWTGVHFARGWGWGPGIGFGLAAADWDVGWGYPGYYDYYDTGPLVDVAPGFISVGFGPTWGGPWWW